MTFFFVFFFKNPCGIEKIPLFLHDILLEKFLNHIDMKKRLLYLMASLLLAGAVSAQTTNFWENNPDSHAQPSNTPIVASVQIDGTAVTATTDMRLGAFVGDDLRGIAAPHDGNFWIQVFYADTTDNITFKFYDGTTETEYTTCETTLAGETVTLTGQDEGYGTPGIPVVLNFTTVQTMIQTTPLAAGWTWWSTPIEMEGNNGLQQLENSISQYGVKIVSQNGSLTKRPNGNWVGGITSLNNEECYQINVSDISTLTMTGTLADPNDHEITLVNGEWTWIGYPVSIQQTANDALANLQPATGDVLAGPEGSAIYRGGQWRPNINLTPGYGYMYNSSASEPKTFVYAVSRASAPSETQEAPYWIANTHKYKDRMIVAAVVFIGDEEQRDETMELGAFVNGECTGTAKLFYIEEDDRYFAVLTVGGDEGDKISFGLVDETKGVIYNESSNHLAFTAMTVVGDFDNPYEIHFDATGIGENSMQVAMYPNPVDRGQSFRLSLPQEEEILDVTVINALGTIVRHETGALKSVMAGLPVAGVYTIKTVCRSGNTYYGRLIVR